MRRVVVPIVEGDGEVLAVPVLLRRMASWRTPEAEVDVVRPIRVRRDRFLNRDGEFSRMLQLAAAKAGAEGAVLVLLDADDDCPAHFGPELAERVRAVLPRQLSAVVLANREFEAWFIAAAKSLEGVRGFRSGGTQVEDPDVPRNAKGWMKERTRGSEYSPVSDQAAFAARIELAQAHERSRSFRKLAKAWAELVA